MKILHLCLASFYIDNFSYQENLLAKYHAKMGNDVEVIASLVTFDEKGNLTLLKKSSKYQNEFGIPVTRIKYKGGYLSKILRRYSNLYFEMEKIKPEIIFIHGVQFLDIFKVLKYKEKHKDVRIFIDNHADFSNSARTILSRYILHRCIWKFCAKRIEPLVEKFYGVLPSRVDFLVNEYGIDKRKVQFLPMGADDELIEEISKVSSYNINRNRFNISEDDFLIVTGGKIDSAKKQILNLLNYVKWNDNTKLKLVFFGSITDDLKEEIIAFTKDERISYLGWLSVKDSYYCFKMADLVVFPGRHSVYWEIVAALGIPMVVKSWEGTQHIKWGDNCKLLLNDDYTFFKKKMDEIVSNKSIFKEMERSANSEKKEAFLYSNISKISIKDYSL